MRQPQQDYDEGRTKPGIASQFGSRPPVSYDSMVGEPVPQEHIDLVLAIRRAERERAEGNASTK